MKIYTCHNCKHPLYFENTVCLHCNHEIGFDATTLEMITLQTNDHIHYTDVTNTNMGYRFCANHQPGTCNWLIPAPDNSLFCSACALNRVIPDLSTTENNHRWKAMEIAKHRLMYSLLRLQIAVKAKNGEEIEGIAFDFRDNISPDEMVLTGHDNGVITININEADEGLRTLSKQNLGEKYRTLLGHFRHEVGHYFWDVFFTDEQWLQRFRQLFGEETVDYGEALQHYYSTIAPVNWSDNYISPYATAHPWEDWAETWAHYLHMMDTLETAHSFGIKINPYNALSELDMQANIQKDPYQVIQFDEILKMWLPLTFAVNSLNRSMGHPDFYPFVISPAVVNKLKFIHELCLAKKTK